ncbi:MAG: class I SAM-dependent rRNA methyltransferase [Deltaproteobacteria bacterium]|nr:class I SAM-dependent rRNA methyltransferase [Deltaproteobacteria bacterium]
MKEKIIPTVVIKKGRAKPLFYGHPWVFSGAVEKVKGEPADGDPVTVIDHEGRLIGSGFYNSHSQITVRIIGQGATAGAPADFIAILSGKIAGAVSARKIAGLPSAETTGFRLFFSEGDRLSGLTVDVYEKACVVILSAYYLYKRSGAIIDALKRLLDPETICVRIEKGADEGIGRDEIIEFTGPDIPSVRFMENGVVYETDLKRGQKGGFYFDQRENRLLLRRFAREKNVLDAFCYTGGFSLNAALAGAGSVAAIDTSLPALDMAKKNAALNGCGRVDFQQADAYSFLGAAKKDFYDVIVIDPPKMLHKEGDRTNALKKYISLNALAISAIRKGGILFTCSCSQKISREDFFHILREAAHQTGRSVSILSAAGAGADHPVLPCFPEGEYLKCFVCRVA